MKSLAERKSLEQGLNNKGYLDSFRMLDKYTLMNTKTGRRVFSNEILNVRKSVVQDGLERTILYQFIVKSGERGFIFQTSGTRDWLLAESYFANVRAEGKVY